jgi:hypothetical protein
MSALVGRVHVEMNLEFGADAAPLDAVLNALETSANRLDAEGQGEHRAADVAQFAAQIDQLEALLDLLSVTGDRQ